MGLNVLMSGCVVCSELRSTSGRRCMKATWSWSTVSSFTVPDDGSEPLAIPTVREVNNNKLRPQLCEGDMVLVDGSEALAILTEKEVNNKKGFDAFGNVAA
ncbi:uncharacterized protein LOC125469910 isoform X2 [Pyrus x bretschneideri]|uniref:uncharacterized protein LOC125469910 isoform X2 n=1 Tax=Pyrus x bretschneideri TaxID=225117 RepID=UPI00203052BA|nr:uncharacterized protein LOC125469910 isoform X2 [Pyrus x bretschneideri]